MPIIQLTFALGFAAGLATAALVFTLSHLRSRAPRSHRRNR